MSKYFIVSDDRGSNTTSINEDKGWNIKVSLKALVILHVA